MTASEESLQGTIAALRQEIAQLKCEKTDLELLIETTLEHSDYIEEDLLTTLESTKKDLLSRIVRLRREIIMLRHEIEGLKQEKADLELLIEMNTKHADYLEEDLLNKVEATLRESERRFRLISETIPVPLTVSRVSDHSIVYANEPASGLFGVSVETLTAYKILDFYAPDVRQTLLHMLSIEGYVNNYELQGQKNDGTPFYGALYARPLAFNDEPCLLCALYDLTMRKQVENEVRRLNEELEGRVKERTQQLEEAHATIVKLEKDALEVQMAGGFAHEMRNALVGAKLMLESVTTNDETLCQKSAKLLGKLYDVIENYIPDDKQKDVLTYFEKLEQNEETLHNVIRMTNFSTTNALEVTTQILEYSRLGHAPTGDEGINLCDVVEQVIQQHAALFAEQKITLRSQLSTNSLLVGYEPHFHAIIDNIVLNARDELIKIENGRDRCITLTLQEENHVQIITITDNANGIPTENLTRIFEPFFSTKPTTGTGLGLSFVSKLVPLYDGTIEVKSEINKGTAFILTFPIK